MKIDIHTHTRKCKQGDAAARDIEADRFCEVVQSTDVDIIAITNHNLFDKLQYDSITMGIGDRPQVWPGVELDIDHEGSRGHLIVISPPEKAAQLDTAVKAITDGATPDTFITTLDKVIAVFDGLGPLYVGHYKQKAPCLSDEALSELQGATAHPERVLKEVANAISAGIYISHGYASIYGSDHHDWEKYPEYAAELPDLRLPVESFEHFCLLLKKDATTINTALNKKTNESITLRPFEDDTRIELKVFNDINILFGPKGTGKSCILRSIAKYYADQGMDAAVFESASDRLDDIFDTKGASIAINLNPLGINYCTDEIKALRGAAEKPVTALSKYVRHYESQTANKNAKRIRIKDLELEQTSDHEEDFQRSDVASSQIRGFLDFVSEDGVIAEEMPVEDLETLLALLAKLSKAVGNRRRDSFFSWKEAELLNSAIELFRAEVERKTGSPAKPTSTGFLAYARNRVEIAANAKAVLDSISRPVRRETDTIGHIGQDKGELELWTDFKFQTGSFTDSTFKPLQKVKKNAQKQFAKAIKGIHEHRFGTDLFSYTALLNEDEDVESIDTVYEMLLFKRYFALDGTPYVPSSGEASMVMLQKELATEKDVYVLDEPERSLGNDYINDVIVPLIQERARAGRKVFISTHDANIAVRTLPYCSVYRTHGPSGYGTFVGNPFSNNLVSLKDPDKSLDWREVSMRTLEGGREAFDERGTIYGQN